MRGLKAIKVLVNSQTSKLRSPCLLPRNLAFCFSGDGRYIKLVLSERHKIRRGRTGRSMMST